MYKLQILTYKFNHDIKINVYFKDANQSNIVTYKEMIILRD